MTSDIERRHCNECCVPLNKVKIGVRIYAGLTIFLMTIIIGGNLYLNKANADGPATTVGIQKDVKRNSEEIEDIRRDHSEKIEDVKRDHDKLVGTVDEIQKTQNRMDRNLSRLLGVMGVKAERGDEE